MFLENLAWPTAIFYAKGGVLVGAIYFALRHFPRGALLAGALVALGLAMLVLGLVPGLHRVNAQSGANVAIVVISPAITEVRSKLRRIDGPETIQGISWLVASSGGWNNPALQGRNNGAAAARPPSSFGSGARSRSLPPPGGGGLPLISPRGPPAPTTATVRDVT